MVGNHPYVSVYIIMRDHTIQETKHSYKKQSTLIHVKFYSNVHSDFFAVDFEFLGRLRRECPQM